MGQEGVRCEDPQLEMALRRVERWRRTRKKKGPMPERLWGLAVDLSRSRGVNPVARALRLDYYSLKGRVEGEGGSEEDGPPDFVEVSLSGQSSWGSQAEVTIERVDGTRMTVRLNGSTDVLRDLARTFLEATCSR